MDVKALDAVVLCLWWVLRLIRGLTAFFSFSIFALFAIFSLFSFSTFYISTFTFSMSFEGERNALLPLPRFFSNGFM